MHANVRVRNNTSEINGILEVVIFFSYQNLKKPKPKPKPTLKGNLSDENIQMVLG